jgi:DNA-3-methyladenine glycosylase I
MTGSLDLRPRNEGVYCQLRGRYHWTPQLTQDGCIRHIASKDELGQCVPNGRKVAHAMGRDSSPASALVRCAWAGSPRAIRYHDEEWGVPVFEDQRLFEMLSLEGAQAGLSWETILQKREHYRSVFDHFDVRAIAAYSSQKVEHLLTDPGIVRNRAKIASVIRNAQAVLALQQDYGSFSQFIWQFVEYRPRINQWGIVSELPAKTAQSDVMSKALRRRGFNFIGSTICYAFMQATGMVNDHTIDCFRYEPLTQMAASLPSPPPSDPHAESV